MSARVALACATALLAAALRCAAAAAAEPSNPIVTQHRLAIGAKTIAYEARAGTVTLRDARDEPIARMFYVAYLAAGADPNLRPVTFLWNGGPGSSSMWLHLGSFGPLRLAVPSNATPPAPRTPLVPNAETLLDTTDLVFVDAPGTGYSEIVGRATAETFYGVDQDARAFAQFVRRWTTENGRWGSPKVLFGESYGTMRAALVAKLVQGEGMAIDGVVLLSPVLDYSLLDNANAAGEDLPYIGFLPTEAAVAWYHHALPSAPPNLRAFLDEVRAFAAGPYSAALMRGDALDTATRRAIVERLHAYTGLDEAYVERADLRLDPTRFEHELLRRDGLTTGRIDGRSAGPALDATASEAGYDPSTDHALGDAFAAALGRYLRDDLRYANDRPYAGTNYRAVGEAWNFRRDGSRGAATVMADLRQAMIENPALRVFAANGIFDLATPFFATEYTVDHLALPPALRDHVAYGLYPAGHMVYLNDEARRGFNADLVRFYREAVAR